jgi:peptidyl-prolyl cis-trans isomerase D
MGEDTGVAVVDGHAISQQELDEAQRERIQRMSAMLGGRVDARTLDTPQMKATTLDGMLSEQALDAEAARRRFALGDAQVREIIAGISAFQKDGSFDLETYQRMLALQGFSEAGFEQRVRTEAARQRLAQSVAAGAMVPHAVLERMQALAAERRSVRRLVFAPAAFLAGASVDEAAVKAEYEAHPERFRTPEQARVEFLVLSAEELGRRAEPGEAEVKAFYEANSARWGEPEQRRASHILITAGKDASAPDDSAALAKARAVLAQVRAKPADFARLARELSRDPGSAAQGGDLGWFGRGMMTKPFEEAVFSLKEGQISEVIKTDFGYHIIELTGTKGGKQRPLAEVRGQIETELRKQAAQRQFAQTADPFTNLVYEQSDGLDAAAARFKLPLQHLDGLIRPGAGAPAVPAALARYFTPAVLEAVFAPDSAQRHHNTKAIDVGNSTLVSVHVSSWSPAVTRPLAEVRTQIEADLRQKAALARARAAGAQRLAALKAKPDDAGFEAAHEVSRRDAGGLPPDLLREAMTLTPAQLPAYLGGDLGDGGYVVLHVLAATPAAHAPEEAAALERNLVQAAGTADQDAYVRALRERLGARVTRKDLGTAPSAPVAPTAP